MSAPLILGTNSIKDTGYNVDNSVRLDGSDSYLVRTLGQAGTSNKAFTFSCWIKRSKRNTDVPRLIHMGGDGASPTHYFRIGFRDDQNGRFQQYHEAGGSGFQLTTNRLFRDESAWYHIVVAVNSADSTESNRQRIYVNGVEETSFSSSTAMSLNADLGFNDSGDKIYLFRKQQDSDHFPGYACEVALIDGQQLAPTAFGEFDEDSPTIWKPKDFKNDVTFGTNGFYLEFKDSSNLGDDTSGNGNDFTVASIASTDQSTDTCTNNFATLNPLNVPTSNAPTFSEGNLISSTSDSAQFGGTSTIGVSSGKWYAEFKSAETGGEEKEMVGVTHSPAEDARNGNNVGRSAGSFAIRFLDGQQSNNNSASAYGSAFSVGDICQVALDIDNNQLFFGKNGQWGDGSGNFNQSTPTSAITITTIANSTEGAYFFAVGDLSSSSGRSLISCNFGSPPFAISSGNADGEGFGNFEYAVPSGYFALCTKNLSEYGG